MHTGKGNISPPAQNLSPSNQNVSQIIYGPIMSSLSWRAWVNIIMQ